MKIRQEIRILILILACTAINFPLQAQNFSVDAGADLASLYIWRGINVNDRPNIQPYISLKYYGLQFGFWGSYSLANINSNDDNYTASQEIDTWLSYSFDLGRGAGITALLTDYYYPRAGKNIGNFNNYDNVNGAGAHIIEATINFTGPESFPLSLSNNVNIYNDEGYNTYFQLDYISSVNEIGIDLFIGASPGSKKASEFYNTEKFNFINVGLKVSKSINITKSFALPVYGSYILNPKLGKLFLVFGISI